ncbi:MAG: NAD(P)-dependent oxidoreductase [Burkholderiales bacterium]|nr:NAD(P)-dependent oxidoreductase [Burkholderiales bacterium]
MSKSTFALLHPGEMGAAVGASAVAVGHRVLCALDGRSEATRARARACGLEDAGTIAAALRQAQLVLSIVPPHGALALAEKVAACGFRGLYVDCNAVAPHTARSVGAVVQAAGAKFVDGGLLGAPPAPGRPVQLILSGGGASEVASLFDASNVLARVVPGPAGAASAVKVCNAAWTKTTWLLLASIYAYAESEGVKEALLEAWEGPYPELVKRFAAPSPNPGKAWRWLAEMEEIAAACRAVGQPDGFALAGAELCRRLESYKDDPDKPSIVQVSAALREQGSLAP